jgi:arginyl-tRNA synthetase
MKALIEDIRNLVTEAFGKVFAEVNLALEAPLNIEIAHCKDAKLGDYQCNSAMRYAKELKMAPKDLALRVVALLSNPLLQDVSIAGPGFINLRINPTALETRAQAMLGQKHLGVGLVDRTRIIVEFSSPNVAKEMHVGHLRSTIIGDSLARVFEFLNYDVLRLNHIGDWGTAFGMLIAHMEEVALPVLTGKKKATLQDLMTWYRESKKHFDEDEAFKKKAQLKVVALQGGDKATLKAWEIICEISEEAYQQIYDLLDVKITTRGESFYNTMLPEVISALNTRGLIKVSEGAKCVFLEGFNNREGEPLPLIAQKADGGYNYATTDLAAVWQRTQKEKARRIIYVVDNGQSLHFAMMFAVARKAGFVAPEVELNHVPFGLVLGADGKKFKTRSGDVERLIDLLTEAVDEAKRILTERGITEPELSKMAPILGINAVKYADLSSMRTQDYVFSYERMLKFEGNTAAFIMYSYVRILSIMRKVSVEEVSQISVTELKLAHSSELALALHLAQFSEAVDYVARELYPHRLCDYLYTLAGHFNAFFRDCRVEGSPEQNSRLLLCDLSAKVFKQGMKLLGLQVLDKM